MKKSSKRSSNAEDILALTLKAEFTHSAQIDVDQIVFEAEFRKLCEINTCRQHNMNYMCPPYIGSPEDCISRVKRYRNGMIVQSVIKLQDSFDYENMQKGQTLHNRRIKMLNENINSDTDFMILGAGPCTICETCKAIDNLPCPNPAKAVSSMEAHCINVSHTVSAAGLKYNYGECTVCYVGIILY